MSSLSMRHPDDGMLLRYIDGELPGRKARQVQRHLEACWKCRTEIEELQATVADCMHYRKNVLEAHLPQAPSPWADLSPRLERIDASFAAEPFWKNLLPRTPALRWSMAAAAAIAVVFAVWHQLQETPAVQAATLLQRAVAVAAQHPQPVRRYRIRSRSLQIIRSNSAVDGSLPMALAARFQAAHYDSGDPLSARAFQAWRDRQAVKTDEVSTLPGSQAAGESYRIQTLVPTGDVASATLTLRATDLHPVDGKLEFRDRDFIEFTELTEPPAVGDEVPVAKNVEVPVRPSVPSGTAAFAPKASASISDELQVLAALHQIGADLGDPIEVKRSGGRVLVNGVGVPAQRQQQIHDMLDSLPNVSVYFANPAAVSSGAPATSDGAAAPDSTRSAPASKIQTRLEQQLGGRAEFERFSSQVLDANDAAMSRAYALRGLAQRFPVSAEAELNAAGRRELRAMAAEHAAALTAQIAAIQRVLNPVLSSLGASAPAGPAVTTADRWQPAAEDLFRASRRVEVLLSLLLGVAPAQGNGNEVPAQLGNAISELRADLDQCQKLLAQE